MADDSGKSPVAKREEETLKFWQENKIFEKSLAKPAPKGEFVFYDGPPFATGLPHHGSLLPSVAKDLIPRYKTMRGYHVRRRWGWDTHGLPVEHMIEEDMGLKSKKDIEAIGIEKFNEACRAKVMQYAHDWQKYADRIGRWVEFENAYKTMDAAYTESVWWALKQMHEKGLLYEGRKVLMYCPHCETPLAKAEIAMDNSYRDITEDAVTAKFSARGGPAFGGKDFTLLAWTTTPWTLPANVALAMGPEIEYSLVTHPDSVPPSLKIREGRVSYLIASALVPKIFGPETKIEKTFLGKELVGLEYEPLFDVPKMKTGKSYRVYPADFVSIEEGTGIVHTAVIYGEDDYKLGLEKDLPMVPLLNSNGTYNNDAPEFLRGQYIKKADKIIIEDLEKRGLLFAKAANTHSYPHCYRCDTPLIYNALSSWFINIQKIKARMIELNEKINWVPEHLKHGRFLNIVENAPDWTISRNRYWASPLPIWKHSPTSPSKGGCDKIAVIGSLEELGDQVTKSGNKYFLMRHGESVSNLTGAISSVVGGTGDKLTALGIEQVHDVAKKLKNLDIIFCSPFARSKETAKILAEILEVKDTIEDVRIGEYDASRWEGELWERVWQTAPESKDGYGEVKKRMFDFMKSLESQYKNKNILILSHGLPIRMLEESEREYSNAEINQFEYKHLPRNRAGEIDYHRPYIDAIKLKCECGGIMTRIPEVVDCWVESGCMPFAEYHYPFENEEEFEKRFPGDFIAEYIAQTRTWFYYMLAISTALFDDRSFKNVVTTGNILAADGSKMSKSKKNYTDPLIIMDQYGADALRYSLMTSVVMQAEDVNFRDEDVKEVYQRLVNILWNVVQFYQTYADPEVRPRGSPEVGPLKSENVLDKWILARLSELHKEVTENLDKFDTIRSSRPIRDFVTDLSTWYIRRSRDRFKSEEKEEREAAISTTKFVLLELSKLLAPCMPFLAEQVYKAIGGPLESVHLEDWSAIKIEKEHSNVLANMRMCREIVSLALEARQKANIKVRQPIATLKISSAKFQSPNNDQMSEYLNLIKEEINVKQIEFDGSLEGDVWLDTTITPELELEGRMRDLVRVIQEKRKELGLQPGDKIKLILPKSLSGLATKYESEIKKSVHAEEIDIVEVEEIKIEKT